MPCELTCTHTHIETRRYANTALHIDLIGVLRELELALHGARCGLEYTLGRPLTKVVPACGLPMPAAVQLPRVQAFPYRRHLYRIVAGGGMVVIFVWDPTITVIIFE